MLKERDAEVQLAADESNLMTDMAEDNSPYYQHLLQLLAEAKALKASEKERREAADAHLR